jgi:hypothetical protein
MTFVAASKHARLIVPARNASRVAIVAWFVGGALALAGEMQRLPPDFRHVEPLPAVRQAAQTARFILVGIDAAQDREQLRPGDTVTALITRTEGTVVEQWVVEFAAAEPDAQEQKASARVGRFFTSSGYEFRFGSARTAIEIRMFGPLKADDAARKRATAPDVKRRRITVSSDFLSLGLDRVPSTMLRVRAARQGNPALPSGSFDMSSRPFPPEVTTARRQRAEAVGINEADERAMAGSALALVEFLQITLRTPGLQDVLKSVLEVPWWSILRSGGKTPGILFDLLPLQRELAAGDWTLPSTTQVFNYPFVLRLNGEPALLVQFAVTAPRPPLLVNAGIVGFAAGRPDGKGPVLTMQIVAARAATDNPRAGGR